MEPDKLSGINITILECKLEITVSDLNKDIRINITILECKLTSIYHWHSPVSVLI